MLENKPQAIVSGYAREGPRLFLDFFLRFLKQAADAEAAHSCQLFDVSMMLGEAPG